MERSGIIVVSRVMPHHFSEEEQLHFVTTTPVFTNMMKKKGERKCLSSMEAHHSSPRTHVSLHFQQGHVHVVAFITWQSVHSVFNEAKGSAKVVLLWFSSTIRGSVISIFVQTHSSWCTISMLLMLNPSWFAKLKRDRCRTLSPCVRRP